MPYSKSLKRRFYGIKHISHAERKHLLDLRAKISAFNADLQLRRQEVAVSVVYLIFLQTY